ncbi:hypothetical protein GXW74_25245 [Roseomonas eburnea]|uniref:Uncharacterized protein n=1 Tax=Neoroseomonas eburnea TaxID=1346889 RepID=A0A9X9XJC2_9PROT|nr:hypothetical protein [Neoroseomonas eburnea]MBR0683808.1 hypothetical protein [Neoroseomonas eburnea]
MAEARLPEEALRRPWHGASDRAADPAIVLIRLQRAEIEVLIAFRCAAAGSEEAARAWRQLATLRAKRVALMPREAASRLPPLPTPPAGALSTWQRLRQRLGLGRG